MVTGLIRTLRNQGLSSTGFNSWPLYLYTCKLYAFIYLNMVPASNLHYSSKNVEVVLMILLAFDGRWTNQFFSPRTLPAQSSILSTTAGPSFFRPQIRSG